MQLHVNHGMYFDGAIKLIGGMLALLAPNYVASLVFSGSFMPNDSSTVELMRILGLSSTTIACFLFFATPTPMLKKMLVFVNTLAASAHAYSIFTGASQKAGICQRTHYIQLALAVIFALTFAVGTLDHKTSPQHRKKIGVQKERGE